MVFPHWLNQAHTLYFVIVASLTNEPCLFSGQFISGRCLLVIITGSLEKSWDLWAKLAQNIDQFIAHIHPHFHS